MNITNPKSFVFTAVPRRPPAATSGYLPVLIQNCFVVSMCQLSSFAYFSIVLGLISNLALVAVVDAAPLILFEDSQFRGIRTEYRIEGIETCINIRGKLNDVFSSVENPESNACFLLCEHAYCRGRCVQITDSVENLTLMNFNDMVSSIQRCPPTTTTTTITDDDTTPTPTPRAPSITSPETLATTEIIITGDVSSSTRRSSSSRTSPSSSR